jgi:hypothetical protein
MYVCIPEIGADFSRRCAHPAMQPPISATHLRPLLDSRIGSGRYSLPRLERKCRSLVCLLTLRSRLRSQPQRDVGGLHRLPYHTYQIIAECVEVRLIPQLDRECFERLGASCVPRDEVD